MVELSTGYKIRVSREVGRDTTSFGNLIITGTDETLGGTELLSLSPKAALQLAEELIRSATLGMQA